ncbi:MAG: hypothetical protein AAGA48_26050 [Myxococcota bacterium]
MFTVFALLAGCSTETEPAVRRDVPPVLPPGTTTTTPPTNPTDTGVLGKGTDTGVDLGLNGTWEGDCVDSGGGSYYTYGAFLRMELTELLKGQVTGIGSLEVTYGYGNYMYNNGYDAEISGTRVGSDLTLDIDTSSYRGFLFDGSIDPGTGIISGVLDIYECELSPM